MPAALLLAVQVPGEPVKNSPGERRVAPEVSEYVLGPGDELTIWALGVPEIPSTPLKISPEGQLDLAIVGKVEASGKTVDALRREIILKLKPYVVEPSVSISISVFRSQPVSVLGAVRNPGVYQLQGRHTILEMISMAGGLNQDAGRSIKIVRRREYGSIPLLNTTVDATGIYCTAELSIPRLMEGNNPEQNILVQPHDVITVPKSQMVYVMGEVLKPGGYVLSEREAISALQALALAGGATNMAAPQHAVILRSAPGSDSRQQIPIQLSKVMSGRAEDIALRPEDILVVPHNVAKQVTIRAIETAVQLGVGVAIWRR